MQLEIINKLYLEFSQIATAKTGRDIKIEKFLRELVDRLELGRENVGNKNGWIIDLINKFLSENFPI